MGGISDVRDHFNPAVRQVPVGVVERGPSSDALPLAGMDDNSPPAKLLSWVDSHRRVLFAALVALYVLGFNGQWRMEPDSALYLAIGKNLAEGNGYTYHGQPNGLAYPGMPWLFAGLFKLFGTRSLLPALIAMPLLGLATLALCYRLFLLHADRATAVLMTLTLGVTRTFYRYCFELLSDLPFLMGVMAFLVGFEAVVFGRRGTTTGRDEKTDGRATSLDWVLLIAGFGMAIVTRPTMWALLLAVIAALLYWTLKKPLRWGRLGLGVVFMAVALAAVTAFIKFGPRRDAGQGTGGEYEDAFFNDITQRGSALVAQVFRDALPTLLQPSASEAVFGIDFGGIHFGKAFSIWLAVLPSLLVIGLGFLVFKRRVLWGSLVLFTLGMMLLRVVHVRYFLQILPLLLYGFWLGAVWLYRRLPPPHGKRVFVGMMAALLGFNIIRVAGFVAEQRHLPFLNYYRGGHVAAIPEVASLLTRLTPEGSWILSREKTGRILTHLSDRYVAEPDTTTNVNPARQHVYVLEPMDADGRRQMEAKSLGVGPAVGDPITARDGLVWQLHEAVQLPPAGAEKQAP